MKPLEVLVVYNEPTLPADDPDSAAEADVLESVEFVSSALAARGHHVRRLAIGSLSQLFDALPQLPSADVVFNLVEGLDGVGQGESQVAGMFELLGYPLTGSASECLALVRDKPRTKWLLRGAGLPTAPFEMLAPKDPIDCSQLRALLAGGPVIVKPAHEDGSLGISSESIVTDWGSLERQVTRVRERYGAVTAERFVVGREFNAAVIALPNPLTLRLAEIEFCGNGRPGWQIVTYNAKWDSGSAEDRATPTCCPAIVDATAAEHMRQLALAAFRVTGCRDYARIDARLDTEGRLFVLEVNSNPDIGPTGGFARALEVAGLAYEDFVDRMVRGAAKRATCEAHNIGRAAAGGN